MQCEAHILSFIFALLISMHYKQKLNALKAEHLQEANKRLGQIVPRQDNMHITPILAFSLYLLLPPCC